jgi:RES domain.
MSETTLQKYLSFTTALELQNRIRGFRSNNLHEMTEREILGEIESVFRVNDKTDLHYAIYIETYKIPKCTRFYRVRDLSQDDFNLPLKGMAMTADAWEPPTQFAVAQRINKAGESLLYTALDPATAILEKNVQENTIFSLIVYESNEAINTIPIAAPVFPAELTDEERIKYGLLVDFLSVEFGREHSDGLGHIYTLSNLIAKWFYNAPQEIQDAWQYVSTKTRTWRNICFRSDAAHQKLDLVGVIVCRYNERNGDSFKIYPHYVLSDLFSNGILSEMPIVDVRHRFKEFNFG